MEDPARIVSYDEVESIVTKCCDEVPGVVEEGARRRKCCFCLA